MDQELKRQLEEIHALAKDNHQMLRAIRRRQLIMDFGKFVVWFVLIALAFFGFQQYVKPLIDTFTSTNTATTSIFGLPTSAEIQKLLNLGKVNQ